MQTSAKEHSRWRAARVQRPALQGHGEATEAGME